MISGINPVVIIREYERLYERIPCFECKPGCHDCCGPIPFARSEWEHIEDKRKATSLDCPYASEEGCAIYSNRPLICRLYGTVPKMQCTHGCRPETLLTEAEELDIMTRYATLIKREGATI
jgi:Fe-S-cluster containining protein